MKGIISLINHINLRCLYEVEDGNVGWAVCSDGLDVAVQLHLQLCRSAATLRPGAHPTGATVQALLKQALLHLCLCWLLVEWVGKAQLDFALEAF